MRLRVLRGLGIWGGGGARLAFGRVDVLLYAFEGEAEEAVADLGSVLVFGALALKNLQRALNQNLESTKAKVPEANRLGFRVGCMAARSLLEQP